MAARKNFFKVFLPQNGTKELGIPPMFRKHLEGELPRNIALIGPSGNQWNVELVRDGNKMVFAKGWEEFFADHSISTGDFIIFMYENHSKFSTIIFDKTTCEKEEAFLAKPKDDAANDKRQAFNAKPKNVAVDRRAEKDDNVVEVVPDDKAAQVTLKRKRAQRSPSGERLYNPHRTGMKNETRKSRMVSGLNSDSGYSIPEKVQQTIPKKSGRKNKNPENDHCDNPNIADRTENIGSARIPLENVQRKVPGKQGRKKKHPKRGRKKQPEKKTQPKNVASCNSNIRNSAERLVTVEEENGSIGESYSAPLKSQRRPVSKEELNRAIDRSEAFRSAYPFISVVMQDSYCYHHFQLNLPFGFAKKHLPTSNTKMTLWDPNGRSWPVAYLFYRRRAALRSGFNRFSYENNLERGDVCIFELIRPDEMRVHIYRVVEEITPLIRFNPRVRR